MVHNPCFVRIRAKFVHISRTRGASSGEDGPARHFRIVHSPYYYD